MYRIKSEDAQYIEEFRKNPIGHHSPGLQRILNLFWNSGKRGHATPFITTRLMAV